MSEFQRYVKSNFLLYLFDEDSLEDLRDFDTQGPVMLFFLSYLIAYLILVGLIIYAGAENVALAVSQEFANYIAEISVLMWFVVFFLGLIGFILAHLVVYAKLYLLIWLFSIMFAHKTSFAENAKFMFVTTIPFIYLFLVFNFLFVIILALASQLIILYVYLILLAMMILWFLAVVVFTYTEINEVNPIVPIVAIVVFVVISALINYILGEIFL